jgi:dihydrofolate reductase
MVVLAVDISISLDGFVAGPSPNLEHPLGLGGERLHEWAFPLESWRRPHGLTGGVTNACSPVVEESLSRAGSFVMGRRMFSGGDGSWGDDPKANGWWGDEPPFHAPVFVLTHHPREPLVLEGTTFTFVTEGIESALERAREAAGEKHVMVAGGASVVQQYLAAGELDELNINLVPTLLGGGTRLLEGVSPEVGLELARVVDSEGVTHLRYRVAR